MCSRTSDRGQRTFLRVHNFSVFFLKKDIKIYKEKQIFNLLFSDESNNSSAHFFSLFQADKEQKRKRMIVTLMNDKSNKVFKRSIFCVSFFHGFKRAITPRLAAG
jgi:hypothetical protein